MSVQVIRYGTLCATLLSLVSLSHAYGHRGAHPKCTSIPASDVYHGTCYFQYVSGKGYVKKTCPSGTTYDQAACGCVDPAQKSTDSTSAQHSGERDDENDDSQKETSDDKSTVIRNLFRGDPFSVIKYLFEKEQEHEHDGYGDNHDDDKEKNGFDDHESDGYGDTNRGGNSNEFSSENGGQSNGDTRSSSSSGRARGDTDDDLNDNEENDEKEENEDKNANDQGYPGPSTNGYESDLNQQKQYRYEDLFVNLFNDDDIGEKKDDNDKDEYDNEYSIVKRYRDIYHEKLDGVLEYVDDIYDDVFDGDLDNFLEDIFDGDGYDDCFTNKYNHFFENDYENELNDKYNDFDEFFKNYDRVKMLTSRILTDDEKDDDKESSYSHSHSHSHHSHSHLDNDDDYGHHEKDDSDTGSHLGDSRSARIPGKSIQELFYDYDDRNDDQGSIWSGKGIFGNIQNNLGRTQRNTAQPAAEQSLLFDFTKMLKRPTQRTQPGGVFDNSFERSQ